MVELQGVWKVEGLSLKGGPVHSQQTHLVVGEDSWREVWDRVLYKDEPRPETTYRVHGDRLEVATVWHEPDGTEKGPFSGVWRFHLDGDVLKVCAAGGDRVPSRVDDHQGVVTTYCRITDPDEIARVTAPVAYADKPKQHHPHIGPLHWDANLSWWKSADGLYALAVPHDADLDAFVDRALALEGQEGKLKGFAADHLLDAHNEAWTDGAPETRDGFIARLTLDGITVHDDLSAEVYFDDGQLFWGHIVIVSIAPDGKATDAQIAG